MHIYKWAVLTTLYFIDLRNQFNRFIVAWFGYRFCAVTVNNHHSCQIAVKPVKPNIQILKILIYNTKPVPKPVPSAKHTIRPVINLWMEKIDTAASTSGCSC